MVQKIHPRDVIWGPYFPPPVEIFSKKISRVFCPVSLAKGILYCNSVSSVMEFLLWWVKISKIVGQNYFQNVKNKNWPKKLVTKLILLDVNHFWKIQVIVDFEYWFLMSQILSLFKNPSLCQITKYNSFLWAVKNQTFFCPTK